MDETRSAAMDTLDDVRDEGLRLAHDAVAAGLPLRMIGGVAVFTRCPSAALPQLARSYGDVDFIALSSRRRDVTDFFEAHGYEQDRMFNALHGASRLNFTDPRLGRPIDVVLDRFSMCHTIDFHDRIELEPLTVPVTDLLLTKLQVVELNDKDVRDLVALLLDHGVDDGSEGFDARRLATFLSDDWGFEHTVRINLAKVADQAVDYGLTDRQVTKVQTEASRIVALLDAAPKSLKWRMRAAIGERITWYALPEEARR